MPSFKCKDIGMECGFEAEAPTKDALVQMVAEHAGKAHGIAEISPDLQAKVEGAIK